MVRVMPGDRFVVSGEGYYDAAPIGQNEDVNGDVLGNAQLMALTGGTVNGSIPLSEVPENMQILQRAFGGGELGQALDVLQNNEQQDPFPPASHLNYIVMDEDMHVQGGQSGALQIQGEGAWTTVGGTDTVKIQQAGYLTVFLSSKDMAKVSWDRILIKHYRGSVIEENFYYPFGLTLSTNSASPAERNNFKLTTKELQTDLGLNWYDFSNRMYDMQRGQWIQHDPLSEQFPDVSPYNYVHNNPVSRVDPTGMGDDSYLYNNETGNYLGTIKDDLPNAAVVVKLDPAQEGRAKQAIDQLNGQSATQRNQAAALVRGQGQSYDVAAFSKFYGQHGEAVPAKTLNGFDLANETDYRFNGKPITPHAEVIGNLVLKNGIVTTGEGTAPAGDMRESWRQDLPKEANAVSNIHTHPVSEDGDFTSRMGFISGPSNGHFTSGVSGRGGDRGDHTGVSSYSQYRQVVVDKKNVYIYNRNPAQTITIGR